MKLQAALSALHNYYKRMKLVGSDSDCQIRTQKLNNFDSNKMALKSSSRATWNTRTVSREELNLMMNFITCAFILCLAWNSVQLLNESRGDLC